MTEQLVLTRKRLGRLGRCAGFAADLLAVTIAFGCSQPTLIDISPNAPTSGWSSAGLTYALAGNDAALYAVSLNAGIWKSNSVNGQRKWSQLQNSPPNAISIAMDPNNASHLVVGERNGDASNQLFNVSGVWESFDGGDHWAYAYNPFSIPCASQAVPSVAFSRISTLFISTACGIGRRTSSAKQFDFHETPSGISLVTAIVPSQHKIWARTAEGILLVSTDDGLTWRLTAPGPASVNFPKRGDDHSLAAFDDAAFMVACCVPNASSSASGLLIYQAATDSWNIQGVNEENDGPTLDGTGCGGRRFVRSFISDLHGSFDLALFFGNAQGVFRLTPTGKSWTWQTFNAALVAGAGCGENQPMDSRFKGPIHNDLWDTLYDPTGGIPVLWLSGDGGVFENRLNGWSWQVDGFHTLHAQGLNVMYQKDATRLAFATPDNDGWFFNGSTWQASGCCGDGNWSDADTGNPTYVLLARTPFQCPPSNPTCPNAKLQAIDLSGTSQGPPLTLSRDCSSGALFLQFIQTLKNEPNTPLDAVMLVRAPVRDCNGNPVTGPWGNSQGPVLLRNTQWTTSPDVTKGSGYQNWRVEATGLPTGTQAFWVSNGHTRPVYYVSSRERSGLVLYKYIFLDKAGAWAWQPIFTGLLDTNPIQPCGAPYEWYGPVFVNPYDPNRIVILATDGVRASSDGGATFVQDPVLTALITASGTYPMTRDYCPRVDLDGGTHSLPIATRALTFATLGHVAFLRENPKVRVASSPFTGVFMDQGDGLWHSLAPYLPQPAHVAAAAIDNKDPVFVAFEGRSVVRIDDPYDAPLASYFQVFTGPNRPPVPQLGGQLVALAKLLGADSVALTNQGVSVEITGPDGTLRYSASSPTDSSGRVLIGVLAAHTGDMVRLQFAGTNAAAGSEVRFIY